MNQRSRSANFHPHSSEYAGTINQALGVTGCAGDCFAPCRIESLARCLGAQYQVLCRKPR